ncbi:MAG: ribosome biogenesis GTPase Der [Acidimicrobiia bacterium]|nr:ribosome biogenesis GTPase Der [Acidimicrobiia bacterium]
MTRRGLRQVVLVGRPNVGKSTLFNRLTATRRSIVTAIAGTTRDVITHPVTWGSHTFELTDTGGLFGASEDPLHELVKTQGARALKSGDVIVMVVDGREGLIPGDEDIAQAARDTGAPVILAINKTDDRRARAGALELSRLGFDTVVEISAEHGEGVGDLLEEIVERLGDQGAGIGDQGAVDEPVEKETAIAIVGRPNAGKSSLVNRLLREERMIVSEVPGTTRDSVDSLLKWHGKTFRIVDTAGIRRPGRVGRSQVESVSVLLAKRAIERADVVVLVLDATVGPTDQDGAIAGAAKEAGKGIIIAANKWDVMKGPTGERANGRTGEPANGPTGENTEDVAKSFDEKLRYRLKFLDYAPILHISAATGERTSKLLEMVERVAAAGRTRVPTGELNRFIGKVTTASPPVTSSKRNVRIKYASQVSVAPPTIVLFANTSTQFHFSYERFLENRLRESYDFFGNPIRIQVRGRKDDRRDDRQTRPDGPAQAGRHRMQRKTVKKGPGSKPTRADRARAARPAKRTTKKRHR